MKLLKSFKTEINPTEEQKVKIRKTIGTCRFIYNFYLAHNKELHENGQVCLAAASLEFGLTMSIFEPSRIFLDQGSLFKIGNTGSK